MTVHLRRQLARHPFRAAFTIALALAALAAGGQTARDWAGYAAFAGRAYALAQDRGAGPTRTVGWEFTWRGTGMSVRVDVPQGSIDEARELPTEPVFMSTGPLRRAYMSTLVRTQSETALVGEIARQLRAYRWLLRLDDDAYLELISRSVQAIPYGTPRARVAPPAAFLAEGRGVCTERSVLLAALLLHEGYDTAVWVLDSQRHVAVGVRGTGPGFRESGYAFIETTRPTYVGEVPSDVAGRSAVVREPQLIQVGGTRPYTADLEAQFIVETLSRTRSTRNALAQYRRFAEAAAGEAAGGYAGLAREHDQLSRMAEWLESASDDRARVFALLTGSRGR